MKLRLRRIIKISLSIMLLFTIMCNAITFFDPLKEIYRPLIGFQEKITPMALDSYEIEKPKTLNSLLTNYVTRAKAAHTAGSDAIRQGFKFVVVRMQGGLGNNVGPTLSGLLLSMGTNRTLIVDGWNDKFKDDMIIPPYNIALKQWSALFSQHWDHKDGIEKLSTWGGVDIRNLFMCQNLVEKWKKTPVVVLRSDQYTAPLLFHNKEFEHLYVESVLGDYPFKKLFHFLFKPAQWLTNELQKYRARVADQRPIIAFQVRMHNKWVEEGTPQLIQYMYRCGQDANINGTLHPFLATDEPMVARDFKRKFGSQLIVPDISGHIISAEVDETRGRLQAWLEIHMMADADVLVTTAGSSFGQIAAALTQPNTPVYMVRRFGKKFARGNYEFGVTCRELGEIKKEPCLQHAWKKEWMPKYEKCYVPGRMPEPIEKMLNDCVQYCFSS